MIDILSFLAGCPNEYRSLIPVFSILHKVVDLFKIFVPILLILFGTIDLAKAVIAGKEDEMKKAQGTLIRRFIYAAAVFLVVTLVTFVMDFVASSVDDAKNSWLSCWNANN